MTYGSVARLFHWITALLVFGMIPLGLVMTGELPRATQDFLFILHKGFGSILLVIILARIGWRAFNPPPPLPASVPPLQRQIAYGTHIALYAALLIMAVSGYVRVTTGGFPIEFLDAVGIPPLLPEMEGVSKIASGVHAATKVVLIGLVAAHTGAAAYHGLVRKDGVFSRMWPPITR